MLRWSKRFTMTIVATARPAPYVDPSALTKLYIREPESAAMNAWRRRHTLALTVTHHGRAEITNAIGRAAFRKQITSGAWRATLQRAVQLSREHTPTSVKKVGAELAATEPFPSARDLTLGLMI
jgi:predicted nucleic acid-binding protein